MHTRSDLTLKDFARAAFKLRAAQRSPRIPVVVPRVFAKKYPEELRAFFGDNYIIEQPLPLTGRKVDFIIGDEFMSKMSDLEIELRESLGEGVEIEVDDEQANAWVSAQINALVTDCHGAAKDAGWWNGVDPFGDIHVVPAKLCLVHSEISEAMEGHRKRLMDDKLPHRTMLEVELADAVIRIFDLAGALGLDLGGAFVDKMIYNASRADHKPENRAAQGGKKY